MRRRGWSMTETLVVIALMALIMAIALPVIGSGRKAAQMGACLANLSQLHKALKLYETEQRAYLPPGDYITRTGGNQVRTGFWTTYLIDAGVIDAGQSQDQLVPPRESPFRCPSGLDHDLNQLGWPPLDQTGRFDTRGMGYVVVPRMDEHLKARYWTHIWYGINGSGEAQDFEKYPFSRVYSDGPTGTHRRNQLPHPATLISLFDGWHMHFANAGWMSARHMSQTRTNLLLFDGHAQTMDAEAVPAPGDLPKSGPRFRMK